MKKKLLLALLLLFWLYAGLNRLHWAEGLHSLGVWNWVDTGLVAVLFLLLNAVMGRILWGKWRKAKWQVGVQSAILLLAILLLVANKMSQLGFLVVYAEQLINLFFSPLLAFLFLIFYLLQKKVKF